MNIYIHWPLVAQTTSVQFAVEGQLLAQIQNWNKWSMNIYIHWPLVYNWSQGLIRDSGPGSQKHIRFCFEEPAFTKKWSKVALRTPSLIYSFQKIEPSRLVRWTFRDHWRNVLYIIALLEALSGLWPNKFIRFIVNNCVHWPKVHVQRRMDSVMCCK